MNYSEIRKVLSNVGYESLSKTEITACMMMALPNDVTDEKFEAMCKYASEVIDNLNEYNTSVVADVIVEAQTEDNTVFENGYVLTDEDIVEMNYLYDICNCCAYRF